jgi:hypothetical protein
MEKTKGPAQLVVLEEEGQLIIVEEKTEKPKEKLYFRGGFSYGPDYDPKYVGVFSVGAYSEEQALWLISVVAEKIYKKTPCTIGVRQRKEKPRPLPEEFPFISLRGKLLLKSNKKTPH